MAFAPRPPQTAPESRSLHQDGTPLQPLPFRRSRNGAPKDMAGVTGLEPATSGVTGRRSKPS